MTHHPEFHEHETEIYISGYERGLINGRKSMLRSVCHFLETDRNVKLFIISSAIKWLVNRIKTELETKEKQDGN